MVGSVLEFLDYFFVFEFFGFFFLIFFLICGCCWIFRIFFAIFLKSGILTRTMVGSVLKLISN